MYKDDFSKFTDNFDSLFEEPVYVDQSNDYEVNFVQGYLSDMNITTKPTVPLLDNMSYYKGSVYIDNVRYDLQYNKTSKYFELSEYLNETNNVAYEEPGSKEWQTMSIEEINNTLLVRISTLDDSVYLFIDCTNKLTPVLAFETDPAYEPVLGKNNKLYFGEIKSDGKYVYSYDTITHKTTIEMQI